MWIGVWRRSMLVYIIFICIQVCKFFPTAVIMCYIIVVIIYLEQWTIHVSSFCVQIQERFVHKRIMRCIHILCVTTLKREYDLWYFFLVNWRFLTAWHFVLVVCPVTFCSKQRISDQMFVIRWRLIFGLLFRCIFFLGIHEWKTTNRVVYMHYHWLITQHRSIMSNWSSWDTSLNYLDHDISLWILLLEVTTKLLIFVWFEGEDQSSTN